MLLTGQIKSELYNKPDLTPNKIWMNEKLQRKGILFNVSKVLYKANLFIQTMTLKHLNYGVNLT